MCEEKTQHTVHATQPDKFLQLNNPPRTLLTMNTFISCKSSIKTLKLFYFTCKHFSIRNSKQKRPCLVSNGVFRRPGHLEPRPRGWLSKIYPWDRIGVLAGFWSGYFNKERDLKQYYFRLEILSDMKLGISLGPEGPEGKFRFYEDKIESRK